MRSSTRRGIVLALTQAATIAAGLGVGALLARGLGAEEYGQYFFALTVVQFMLFPLDFGLPTLVMREVAVLRGRGDWALLLGLLRWSSGLVVMVLALLVLGVLVWQAWDGIDTPLYLFSVALAGIWAYMRLAAGVLRGMERVVWAALPDQVIRPLMLLLALAVLPFVMSLTPARAMALHTLAAAVGLGWALWMLARRHPPVPPGVKVCPTYAIRKWLRSVLPLGFQAGAGLLNRRVDVLMLGVMAESRQVGLYGLAVLVGGIASMSQGIVNQMIAPRFAKLQARNDVEHIGYLARRTALVALLGGLIVIIAVALLGEPMILGLVGQEYAGTLPIAILVCSGPTIAAAFGSVTVILNMSGHERLTAQIVWISAFFNVILNGLLIPLFGALGAAIATSITVIAARILLWVKVRQILCIRPDVLSLATER